MIKDATLLRLFTILFFIGLRFVGASQSTEITVRFIGNCGLYMTDGLSNIYIDFPYKSGAHNYMEYDLKELDNVQNKPIFIYTHKHSDHYSGKLVKRLAKKLDGAYYTPWSIKSMMKLNGKIPDFKIEAFKTRHIFSINHYSYLITWHGKKIFISGDTEHSETLAAQSDVDWVFLPAWLLMEAVRNEVPLKEVGKMFAVYHIGPLDNINITGEKIIMLDKQGRIISIPIEANPLVE